MNHYRLIISLVNVSYIENNEKGLIFLENYNDAYILYMCHVRRPKTKQRT